MLSITVPLIASGLAYAVYKETRALGCSDILKGEDCDNANGKAVKGTKSFEHDDTETICSKIKDAADFADKWVMWRIALLSAGACTLLLYFVVYKRKPDVPEVLLTTFTITSVIYFMLNFYKFHLINYVRNNIVEGVNLLARRIS